MFNELLTYVYYKEQIKELKQKGHKLYKRKYKCTICNKKGEFKGLGIYLCSDECRIKIKNLIYDLMTKELEDK